MKPHIKYSEYIIGCRINDTIYIHPALEKEDPVLYKAVLAHEMEHSSGFSKKDMVMDLFNDELEEVRPNYYSFMFKHPKTILGLFPINRIGGRWSVDIMMLILLGLILVVSIIMYLGVKALL